LIVQDHLRAFGRMISLTKPPTHIMQQRRQSQRSPIARAKVVQIVSEIEQFGRDRQHAQLVIERLELTPRVVGRGSFAHVRSCRSDAPFRWHEPHDSDESVQNIG
jgi:hypothetical protein